MKLSLGTNAAGSRPNANGGYGIYIGQGASFNVIGSSSTVRVAGRANLISGNWRSGVFIDGVGANSNMIRGALIGVDAGGNYEIANGEDGITIGNGPIGTTVGVDPDELGVYGTGNVISGNRRSGVSIFGTSTFGTQVAGNIIGANRAGTTFVPNGDSGITVWAGASGNLIGTNDDNRHDLAERNTISGNRQSGVLVRDPQSASGIYGNYIGTTLDGLSVIANGGDGVTIAGGASGTVIGDFSHTRPDLANVISGNFYSGVRIGVNGGSDRNVVAGNRIGTNVNLAPLPNGWAGVSIVENSRTNRISRNSIYANYGLGIDLNSDGVTPNDIGDADGGSNLLLNFPIVTSATATSPIGPVTVQGIYGGLPNSTLTVELFSSPSPDPSGFGEGLVFVGEMSVTTNAAGHASFVHTSSRIRVGDYVTAVGIDQFGNTSEFSGAAPALIAPGRTASFSMQPSETFLTLHGIVNVVTSDDQVSSSQHAISQFLEMAGIRRRLAIISASHSDTLGN